MNKFPDQVISNDGRSLKRSSGYGVRTPAMLQSLEGLVGELITPRMVGAEIGCHTGISTEAFAKRCQKIYAIDFWDDAYGMSAPEIEDIFDFRMSNYDNVVKIKGRSNESCKDFEDGSLDFIYIDAAHAYGWVIQDIKNWSPKVKKSGLVMGHDYMAHDGVTEAVDEFFGKPDKVYKDNSWVVCR